MAQLCNLRPENPTFSLLNCAVLQNANPFPIEDISVPKTFLFYFAEEVEVSSPLSTKTATPCSLDSSSTTIMERLNYLSKGRSASSDELTIASSDQPCSKRSRVSYNNSIHHRQQLEREQRRHHLEFQRRQDVLRKHEEHAAAVVLAQQQHQQREHFLQSMRARQHQHDRQAALSTLAAANLAAYRQQSSAQTQLTLMQMQHRSGVGSGAC